jgi:hypothetical protein
MSIRRLTAVLSVLCTLTGLALALSGCEEKAIHYLCGDNVHAIAVAMGMYAEDHAGRLPNAGTWMDDIRPYLVNERVFRCPNDEPHKYAYAMNSKLSGLELRKIPDRANTVLIFESDADRRNAADPMTSLSRRHRHKLGKQWVNFVAYANFDSGPVPVSDRRPRR